jgi:hypothetical protein
VGRPAGLLCGQCAVVAAAAVLLVLAVVAVVVVVVTWKNKWQKCRGVRLRYIQYTTCARE